ncbi:short chain dehydrogenase family protein [Mycobacterium intracellulare]|nr:short chain dehydrogenase family protein [Mycobacterium intracellulare]
MNQTPNPGADGFAGSTAIVTGAGRGFGRAIATALATAGAEVVGVARTRSQLEEVRAQLGDAFTPVVADAADPATAGRLIDRHRPRTLVLCAGRRRGWRRCRIRPGSRSATTGTPTSRRRFTGFVTRCGARWRRAAR